MNSWYRERDVIDINSRLWNKHGTTEPTCDGCFAPCCGNIIVQMNPFQINEDYIFHILLRPGCHIRVDENNKWWLYIDIKCSAQLEDGKCGIYEDRPVSCHEYSNTKCARWNQQPKWKYRFDDPFNICDSNGNPVDFDKLREEMYGIKKESSKKDSQEGS